MNESRKDNFKRLAKKRVERAADQFRKIGNLSSPNYEYTIEDVDKLFEYLQHRLDEAKGKFKDPNTRIVPFVEF